MDNANLIEKSELEIWGVINQMHRENVRYTVVHDMLVEMVKALELQGYCEDWLNQFNKDT